VLDAINGYDRTDPSSIAAPFAHNSRASIEGLRLGYFPADSKLDGIEELDRAALDIAKRVGLSLVPRKRPDLPYDSAVRRGHDPHIGGALAKSFGVRDRRPPMG
jgi:hypothetical protein